MFKYDQNRDRFIPDRSRNPYSFYSVHLNPLNHLCVSLSNCKESDFIEPFECERQQEQQTRAFRQMQSHMSLQLKGGHLLGTLISVRQDEIYSRDFESYLYQDEDMKWPIRLVDQRRMARKSITKTCIADLLLDMPNLSNNWMTKILDWSSTGYLTVAIESSIHLWSDRTQCVHYTIQATELNESASSIKTTISCLKWDTRGEILGYSFTVDRVSVSSPLSDDTITDTDSHSNTSEDSNDSTIHGSPAASRVWMNTAFHGDRLQDNLESTDANTPEQHPFNTYSEGTTPLYNDTKTHYIKVWLLNGEQDGSNSIQKSSTCGCLKNDSYQRNECTVVVMDWLTNGRILVTGCTRGTVTFFIYDFQQKQLITTRAIHFGKLKKTSIPTLISCLHVSLDKWNRHLAVAFHSRRLCVLKVFRVEDSPELFHNSPRYDSVDLSANLIETLTDRYRGNHYTERWVIKAFAWHPWKHSLMCYAVVSVNQDVLSYESTTPSWLVLANACKGQVLRRVEQTSWNTCPTVKILSVSTHSLTFSCITGELLVSTTTAYRVQKSSISSTSVIEKHSVVVMHALNRIVETLSCSLTEKGISFTWSPNGLRIALTSSDECLRIWNFWPTIAVKKKSDDLLRDSTISATFPNTPVILMDSGSLNNSSIRSKYNCHLSNQSMMSELSLDASRIIK